MNKTLTRRGIVIGGGIGLIAAVAVVQGPKLLRKRHAPSPYDDLLDKLDDRDACAQIGEAALAGKTGFNPDKVAAAMRARLHHQRLAKVALDDARQGKTAETAGWVMPETLSLLCALAAKAG